jgi:uncharacterized protein (DUF1501 family)
MTMQTRRNFLKGAAATALLPMMGRLTLAAAPGDNRFVCILLRGGMDGLDVVRPVGDKAYAALRPESAAAPNIDLDGHFAMHPSLGPLETLFRQKQLSFIHAVATPYRDRSHFEGQDILEQGGETRGLNDGWLNRMLGLMPKTGAVDIGTGGSLLLSGQEPVKKWYPETRVDLRGDSLQFLEGLYADDPLLAKALAGIEADQNASMEGDNTDGGVSNAEVARLAGRFLSNEARIAAFSINGWDTHIQQGMRLSRQLGELSKSLLALKDALGANWNKTAVVMCSEFGRTARYNGAGGTDHGTGGLAVLAGGLLANGQGGKVLGAWPGLSDLYEDRDLMPTSDLRLYLASLGADLYGLDRSRLATTVFPGLDFGSPVRLL